MATGGVPPPGGGVGGTIQPTTSTTPGPEPAPEPHLQHFTVIPRKLQGGEYSFIVLVDFTISPKDDTNNIHDLLTVVTATGNDCGGLTTVIDIYGRDVPNHVKDAWKRNMQDTFSNILGEAFQPCIEYRDYENKGLHILVKPFRQPVSTCPHVYLRLDEKSSLEYRPTNLARLLFIRRKSPLPNCPSFPLKKGSVSTHRESKQLELKYWKKASTLSDYKHMFTDKRILKAILALMNELNGGVCVVGVEEKQQVTVRGQMLSLETQGELKQFLEELINSFVKVCKSGTVDSVKHFDYEVAFEEIEASASSIRRVLIILRFASVEGLVCEKEPESFTVNDEGFIRRRSVEEWTEAVMSCIQCDTKDAEVDTESSVLTHLRPSSSYLAATTQSTPALRKITSLFKRLKISKNKSKQNVKSNRRDELVNTKLQQQQNLSYTTENPNWDANLIMTSKRIDTNLEKLLRKSSVLQMKSPVNFTPRREVLLKGCRPHDVSSVIRAIESACEHHEGVAIAQTSWLSLIPGRNNIKVPEKLVMDILLLTSRPALLFSSVVDEAETADEEEEQFAYMFQTARLLKKYLLHPTAQTHFCHDTISIACRLQYLYGPTKEGTYQEMINKYLHGFATTEHLRAAVVTMLLSKDTWLKQDVDTEKNIKMTSEQVEKILAFGIPCQFNFIEGPPGSGKSLLGLALAEKYLRHGHVAWIVTTEPFQSYLRSKGMQSVYVVDGDESLKQLLQSGKLQQIKCILMDDVHHCNCSAGMWKAIFAFVASHNVMYILQDNNIQNYKVGQQDVQTLMIQFCKKAKKEWNTVSLTEMHRNDKKVASFIMNNAGEKGELISCANESEGHEVSIISMLNTKERNERNELVSLIRDATNPQQRLRGSTQTYRNTDIAILVDGPGASEYIATLVDIIRLFLGVNVHDATVQPPRGITIDTVHNFMGLEAKMCVFLTRESATPKGPSRLENAKYRAFLASRAISRAVFMVETLTTDVARIMQFGNLERFDYGLTTIHPDRATIHRDTVPIHPNSPTI